MRQPYGRAIASTVTLAPPHWWSAQGFLVIVQDVRGQGESQGEFRGFAQEAADTADTLAWVRSRPDCNGRIGLYGFSYQGFSQLVGDSSVPPPDCLAPAMTGLDERDHWSCEGGAHWWHLGLGWGLQLAALQAARRGDVEAWGTIRCALETGSYLREGPALLAQHDRRGMAHRWLSQDPRERQRWALHSPPPGWLARPMLLIGGWWDPHLRGILDLHARCLASGGEPELHIGPATHLQWWPEVQELHRRFFQRHLIDDDSHDKGPSRTTAPERPNLSQHVHLWDQRLKRWGRGATDRAEGGCWQLWGNALCSHDPSLGELKAAAETTESSASSVPMASPASPVVIVHDPWRPAPAIGGHLSASAGPCDRRSLDARNDVATFTSQPLDTCCRLRGRPELRLIVWADQPGFDLCAALSVCPSDSDRVEQLSTGVMRCLGPSAQEAREHRLELQALEAELQPGDRLRLSLAGAAWPAIAINPGHTQQPCSPPSSHCRIITITLRSESAHLRFLPLIPAPSG
jgi:predicted acyl esterase